MQKGDYIFVYGTLRRGERAELGKQAHNFDVKFCGEDAINAKMFHLGAYPGIKLLGEPHIWDELLPAVTGEVFRILNTSIVALMDAYEGYDADSPERGLYNRKQVETAKGKIVWVYLYNPPVTSDQLIEGGDWCKNQGMPVRNKPLRL